MKTDEDPLAQYRTPQAMADTHAAYARGEKIEFMNIDGRFQVTDEPTFNWPECTYRPAPKWEPKVGEVVLAKLIRSDTYRLCFYAGYRESYYEVWHDVERSGIFHATDIKPFTQDK